MGPWGTRSVVHGPTGGRPRRAVSRGCPVGLVVDRSSVYLEAGDASRAVEDRDPSVRIVVNPDLHPDVMGPEWRGRDLQVTAVEAHRVVVADDALLVNAEHLSPLVAGDRDEVLRRFL